jgi:hypothetical protein
VKHFCKHLAGEEGFEPSLADPESAVLPLDDSPAQENYITLPSSLATKVPGLIINLTPLIPSPSKGRRRGFYEEGLTPLLDTPEVK